MISNGHVDSYYAAQLADSAILETLCGGQQAEICVVGGGLAGLTTARELAVTGHKTVLLEAERVGWGASGRNGGFVSAGYAAGLDGLEARLGVDHTRALYDLSRHGVAYVREMIATAGAGGIVGGQGWLKVIRHDDADSLRRRRDKLRSVYGADVEFWGTDRVRSMLATETYFHALHDTEPFHIDPLAYVNLLANSAKAAGALVFERSPAAALARKAGGWRVTTPNGHVDADTVVLAGSAYQAIAGLWPELDRAVLPVATYVVTTEPLGRPLAETIKFGGCIADTRRAGDYYRIVGGDRLLWGGRITTRRSQPAWLASMLTSDISAIYPQLSDLPISHAWSGLMGYAVHKMPIIRPLRDGLWAATAFGGHGLAATATAGMLVAAAIDGNDDRWKLFDAFGTRWGGGLAGRAVTQTVYWAMQLRDLVDERFGR